MSQYVSDSPVEKSSPAPELERKPRMRLRGMGITALFVLIGLSLLLFSGQIILSLGQAFPTSASTPVLAGQIQASPSTQQAASSTPGQAFQPTPTMTPAVPFFTPNSVLAPVPTLQLPGGHYVLYQSTTHIYLVSTTDYTVTSLYTPDYAYNQAVRPLLTPAGQLLYSGDRSIWLTDIFDQQPTKIVQLAPNVVITSLVLSQDGQMIAWSTKPLDGNGQIDLYAGSLASPQLIHQHSALDCPCFRVFSFLNGNTPEADNMLLLTDDRGSSEAVQYGLWALDITNPTLDPTLVMDESPQQGPLALAPYSNTLLYSPNEEAVPVPTDNSVPSDVAALSYANSLSLTMLDGSPPAPIEETRSQVALPAQQQLANNALYRWVTTPIFSPDGHTLAYVEFSSDAQAPYDRHSALYTIQVSGSGAHLRVSHPQLIATSTSRLLELGPWLNSHVVTMYGDGALYALDVQSGALTTVSQPGGYVRIVAIVGSGQT